MTSYVSAFWSPSQQSVVCVTICLCRCSYRLSATRAPQSPQIIESCLVVTCPVPYLLSSTAVWTNPLSNRNTCRVTAKYVLNRCTYLRKFAMVQYSYRLYTMPTDQPTITSCAWLTDLLLGWFSTDEPRYRQKLACLARLYPICVQSEAHKEPLWALLRSACQRSGRLICQSRKRRYGVNDIYNIIPCL